MLLFLKRYVLALVVLLVAMGGYRLLVVPAIEPPPRPPTTLPEFSGALGGPQWWQALFASGAWQIDNPQIIQSKRGVVLLSREYKQTGPRTLSLKPLTIVLPQSRQEETEGGIHDVLIISVEGGAEIHFEEDFDPSGAIPSVERGELSGLIEVTRRVQGQPNAFPWSLRTSHLSLNRSQVFTPHAVTIEWPEGIIEGHDMRLTLQGDLLGAKPQSTSPWGPLRTLELYHLDRLEMTLANGGLWGRTNLHSPPDQPPLDSLPAHLQVACGGRFTFDFTQSQATLVNGVQLVHQLGSLPADVFQSQEVLVVVDPPNQQSPAGASQTGSPPKLGAIQVKLIEATGIDSLENFVGERKVEVKAPTIGAYATAKRLRIDLLENRLELDGKLNHPGATQSTAWLKYQGYEFTAPRIDYDSDGKSGGGVPGLATTGVAASGVEPPRHLGFLIATGSGELRLPAQSRTGKTLVRWQDSLEMRPTEIAGQQWVGLFGGVLIESAQHGYLASDELEIWLRENNSTPTASSLSSEPSQGQLSGSQFLPERMRAVGQVALNTQQIKAHVEELSLALNFVNNVSPNSAADGKLSLSDSAGRPMYQFVGPPDATNAAAENSPPAATISAVPPPPTLHPTTVLGRTLTSTVIVAGEESWVDNLTVTGPLQVSAVAAGPKQPGWNVTGDELQMATNPAGQVDLQITGQPARITLAEGSLKGPMIRFDQRNNLVWMDHPGEFTIPTSAFASPQSSGAASLDWFEPPHCTWQGRMMFDGKIVRIEGDIRFDGAVAVDRNQFWWIDGQSEVLQLELSDAVDLDDLEASLARPKKVTLSQNVNILAAQLDANGTKRSRQQLQFPSLAFDIQTNELIGLGPGSIRSWHIAQDSVGQMASTQTTRAPENLQGAHLVFRESMRGFLDRSELYFQGKVELAAGPLATWDDAIDLARMQRLTMNQLHLDCDLLKVYDTSGLSSTGGRVSTGERNTKAWEFQAKGNVNFAGKADSGDYEGNGSEIAYVQAKELLTLLGEPRRPARVIIKPAPPSQASVINASVEYAVINPRIPSLESYKMGEQGIDVQLQDPNNPQAGPVSPSGPIPNPRGTVSDFFRKP